MITSCSPSFTRRSYSRLTSVAPIAVSSTAAKPSFCKAFSIAPNSHAGIIGHKGRGQTDIHRRTGRNQRPGSFGVVSDFFGVLRAVDKALAAQNALIVDNIGLVIGKFNRLDRAMPDTFIAVFTVGFF